MFVGEILPSHDVEASPCDSSVDGYRPSRFQVIQDINSGLAFLGSLIEKRTSSSFSSQSTGNLKGLTLLITRGEWRLP